MTVQDFLNMCEVKEWYSIYICDENVNIRYNCVYIDEVPNELLLRTVKSFSVEHSCDDELLMLYINVA